MKLDTVIPTDPPAIVAEVGQRRLGKYQVLGSWKAEISLANFTTTLNGAPTVQPKDLTGPDWQPAGPAPALIREALPPPATVPTSIRLAIDPTIAQEGDE